MSKILKKAMIGYNGASDSEVAEITVDNHGQTMYVNISSIGEDDIFYLFDHSMFETFKDGDYQDDYDKILEDNNCLFEAECGAAGEFDSEEDLSKHEYYNCMKYIFWLVRNTERHWMDTTEVTTDYGKDIDAMAIPKMASLLKSDEDDNE